MHQSSRIMPSCKDKKKAIPSVFEGIASTTRHNQLHGTITKTAKTVMVRIAHDDVVEDFDFEKLAGSDEIASNLDVRFGRGRFTARVIVGDYDCGSTRHDG